MSLKLSRKNNKNTVSGSAGTLLRSGNTASRGNVAKNKRTSNSNFGEKNRVSLVKKLGTLITLPLRKKNQPPIAGEVSTSRNSVIQPGKSFVFALNFSQLFGAGTILALLVIWAFFLGILMGRSMKNSPMRAENSPQVPPVESLDHSAEESAKTPRGDTVIMPEDLHFLNDPGRKSISADVLTSAPLPTDIPQLTAVQRKTSEKSVQNATPTPSEEKAMPPTLSRADPASREIPQNKTPSALEDTRRTLDPASPQFEYIFQVAAGTELKPIQALQKKLQKEGLSVSIEHATKNNAPLYRVLVTLRGSQEDSQALRSKLQKLNLRSSFLRSKKNL